MKSLDELIGHTLQTMSEDISDTADISRSVYDRIGASKKESKVFSPSPKLKSNRKYQFIRWPSFVLALLLLGITTFLTVPPVQGAVLQLIDHVRITFIDRRPILEQSSQPSTEETLTSLPLINLDQAEREVGFVLPRLTYVPEELVVQGAFVRGQWVRIVYREPSLSEGPAVSLEIQRGGGVGQYTFPQDVVEQIMINDQPATYIHGAWNQDVSWNENSDTHSIAWSKGEFSYFMQISGLSIHKSEAIAIAEGVE